MLVYLYQTLPESDMKSQFLPKEIIGTLTCTYKYKNSLPVIKT